MMLDIQTYGPGKAKAEISPLRPGAQYDNIRIVLDAPVGGEQPRARGADCYFRKSSITGTVTSGFWTGSSRTRVFGSFVAPS